MSQQQQIYVRKLSSFVNRMLIRDSGGGIIGGYGHENVRKAAIDFVNLDQNYFPKMAATDSFPLPKAENVGFYILLTNRGKYSVEKEIENNERWLRMGRIVFRRE